MILLILKDLAAWVIFLWGKEQKSHENSEVLLPGMLDSKGSTSDKPTVQAVTVDVK
jgi:hypothetical protein